MKTGISSHLFRRAITSLPQNPVRLTGSIAHVHAVGFHPVVPQGPMFGRALEVKRAADATQAPGNATRNHALEKQLFPSSSPGVSSGGNAKIDDMLKPRITSSGSARQAIPPTTAEPLRNRSLNVNPPRPRSGHAKAFESLFRGSDSFTESGYVIDLVDDIPAPTAANSIASLVHISDGDFSDDENLDFEAPSALPSLPRTQSTLPPPTTDAPSATHTSTLSWSQSSPSHLVPPKAVKRESPDDDSLQPRAVKKRQLPKSFGKPATKEEDFEELYEAAAHPAPQSKEPAPWNATVGEVKAQKKQLKTQLKGSAPVKAGASMEEIHEAVISHNSKKTAAVTLSEEQQHVKSLVVDKSQSVFFTGPAGTGKSVLMRAIIAELKKKYVRDPERIAVTASTGLAACNIGGMTLHSFAGIGLGKEDAQTLVKKIRRNPKAKNRWLKTKTLIIDEISMVDGELFDKLSQIGRIIRNNGRPWGGIQLVITGDFFQLPPVPEGNKQRDVKFAFDAATWNMSIDHTIGLTEVFRQRDPVFAEMLNEMRLGRISERTIRNFQSLSRPLSFDDGLEVTELFPTRNEVENSNQRRLKALSGKSYRYDAIDTGDVAIRDKLLANMMAPPSLELKKGAQVMLIKNMDETLVNGSLGTVIKFMSEATFEIMAGDDGDDAGGEMDVKKRIRAFTNALDGAKSDNKEYPLVRFHAVDGTVRDLLCIPEDWKVELPTGEVQASRKQLPLILAWALSIHKAQGQTLERVKVDLGRVFEKGQAYVALSRATTQQGLQVLRFQKDKVMAHPRVVGFYNKLYSAESAVNKKAAGSITSFVTKTSASVSSSKQKAKDIVDVDDDEEAMAAAYG